MIYYMLDATRLGQWVKIGLTTNLARRVDAVRGQTRSRQTPVVLAVEPGHRDRERELHEQFADLRAGGEWFRYEDRLRKHVETLPHPYGAILDDPTLLGEAGGWLGVPTWDRDRSIDDDPTAPSVRF